MLQLPTTHRVRSAARWRWPVSVATLALASSLLPLLACSDSPTDSGELVAFQTLAHDSLSARYVEPRREVVRDAVRWRAVWGEFFPGEAPPSVDFSREMTLVAVMELQPCTAEVTIEAIRVQGEVLAVSLVERPTPAGCNCVVPVQPFHIVRTERSDREVRFDARPGTPPVCGS